MEGRWNIQEVPISFNLYNKPNMGAARVLQDAPNGYLVFINKVDKNKPIYRAVVSPQNEQGQYKYQVSNCNGIKKAKESAYKLLKEVMELNKQTVKMNPREYMIRKRLGYLNKDDLLSVKFIVSKVGDDVVITVNGKDIDPHTFMIFKPQIQGQTPLVMENPFNSPKDIPIVDNSLLNMVRDYFIVLNQYYQPEGVFNGPLYEYDEIVELFDLFNQDNWIENNNLNLSLTVKGALINRDKHTTIYERTNQYIPFTVLNERYRKRGNRGNPSRLIIIKGGDCGVIKLIATATRGKNILTKIELRFADGVFSGDEQNEIMNIVNIHKRKNASIYYRTKHLKELANEIVAHIIDKTPMEMAPTRPMKPFVWTGSEWDNEPVWIYND